MVHKRNHRGVHSGNTLRAFNSRFSRRYHNQSCIVSRVGTELLQKLVISEKQQADDRQKEKPAPLQNIAVDVPLSLNKQSRWGLPLALILQIQRDDIADSKLTVSLLERHKLKQRASCVSFHSNKGEVRRIVPKNGRYFGFSYPTTGGKSRRALRREMREEALGLAKNSESKMKGKTAVVFTETGRGGSQNLGESEVRYEVYYPSSAISSISHNPKYIKQDVDVSPGENEHVLHGKPKKQHRGRQRKRITLKDLDDYDLPQFSTEHNHQDLMVTAHKGEGDQQDESIKEQTTTECLLATLIEKAQRLQNFKGNAKTHRKKKTGKNSSAEEDNKSHIIYLNDAETPSEMVENPPNQPSSVIVPSLPDFSESTRVMLPKEDVTMESLKDCFGQAYFEAACTPRKFVLDVTANVQDVMKKRGSSASVAEKLGQAYLICIHDGFYDDEFDVYKILLNSSLHQGLLAVQINCEESQDLYRGTLMNLISRTMDFVEVLVKEQKNEGNIPLFFDGVKTVAARRHFDSHLASAEAYVPSLQYVFHKGSEMSQVAMPTLMDQLEEDPKFCDVCYDDISPLTHGSAAYTSLLKCKHHVCDSCWSQHIHIRLHEGFVRLTCPGYDCQDEVKVGVLLSVVPLDTAEKLLQRQEEVHVGGSQTKKWCPNEACGRVISLQPSAEGDEIQHQQDVVCACGTHVCFQCLTPAHWPASCKQAEEYRANLASTIFPDRLAEVHDDSDVERQARIAREMEEKKTMLVEGKHCPSCRSFVCKIGGCPQMSCRCGQLFCWFCAKPGYSHPNRQGCLNASQEKNITTTLLVRHLEAGQKTESSKERKPVGNRRQRMSLTEKAVEHRKNHQNKYLNHRTITALSKTIASAAAKNKSLSQHIIKACVEAFPSSSCKPNHASAEFDSSADASLLETVTTFLKNAVRSRLELHEVVEYSLVLLKDLPDSLLRRRALRVTEDLGAFCSFSQSVFDAWTTPVTTTTSNSAAAAVPTPNQQDAVKAVMRLAEIQGWIQSALVAHVVTVKKLRKL